ncbi:oxidoreductase, partial [Salmonella enterica]|nr:oxidoreductase [Salmonella enterica]
SFQRCDEDLRERLQSSSVSDLLNGLKDKASTAYDAVNGVISGRL